MKNSECTMLANHSTNLEHNFDFCNPKILDKEHNLEVIEILNNTNMACFSNVYKQFLEKNISSKIFIFFIQLKVIRHQDNLYNCLLSKYLIS